MRRIVFAGIALLAAGAFLPEAAGAAPDTLIWHGDHLAAIRGGQRNEHIDLALATLKVKTRAAQKNGVYSVVDKKLVPASGDRHDYASFGRYWWPNPNTPDGLPYVRRDGEVNPQMLAAGDRVRLSRFCDDVEACALAGYLLKDDRAADYAARLVRVWFLEKATQMRPRLRYAQAVPGRTEGRGAGVLDARNFLRIIDSIACLRACDAWSDDDQAALIAWFAEYLQWLRTSPIADDERSANNNHGVWFDAQEAGVACFVGEADYAAQVLKKACAERLPHSLDGQGRQPHELTRTQSLHYSMFTMEAWFVLARLGERLDIDVWDAVTEDGVGLRAGLRYPAWHLTRQDEWPHPMLSRYQLSDGAMSVLMLAADRWGDAVFLQAINEAPRKPDGRAFAALRFRPPPHENSAGN
ncbi:MAG: alginate lyase family protein [Planctomycetota bacterium]